MIQRVNLIGIVLCWSLLAVAQHTNEFVDIKGGQLYYKIFGTTESTPLLFLNGGPGLSSEGYHTFVEALAKNRTVILFDQRGTGKSKIKHENGFSIHIKKMVEDIEVLRTHLGIETWDVMGNSFGGTYGMFYAAKYPTAIRRMVLSSSGAMTWGKWRQLQKFKRQKVKNKLPIEEEILKTLSTTELPEGEVDQLMSGLNARFYVHKPENIIKAIHWFMIQAKSYPHISKCVRTSIKDFDLKKKLKDFDKPTLIIHGMSDFINLATPLETHETLPNSKLEVIHESGHMIWLDQPERLMELIDGFLE